MARKAIKGAIAASVLGQAAQGFGAGIGKGMELEQLLAERALKKEAMEFERQKQSEAKAASLLEQRMKLLPMTQNTTTFDAQGNRTDIEGMRGISIDDNFGLNYGPDYSPGSKTVKTAAPNRGSIQQSQWIDSDGTPLLFDRDNQRYVRSDNGALPAGKITPAKGNAEAVQSAGRGAELYKKVDPLFDELQAKGDLGSRAALLPGVRNVAFPEINQMRNELRQAGFSFGGKNYTGTEAGIIEGTLVPNSLDSPESMELKRQAVKGYLKGQIDLLGAANLLGASGVQIKTILDKDAPSFSSEAEAEAAEAQGLLKKGQRVKIGGVAGTWE